MTFKGQKVYAVIKKGFSVGLVCNNPFPQPYFDPFENMAEICSVMANKKDAIRVAEQLTEHELFYKYEVREFELG